MNTKKKQREIRANGPLAQRTISAQKRITKQDVNLRKRGFLHFQLGLILALLLVFFALQLTLPITPPEKDIYDPLTEEPEMIAVVLPEQLPEIPKPKAPEQKVTKRTPVTINPEPDFSKSKMDIKEFINTTPDPNTTPIKASEINVLDFEEEVNIMAVEEIPVFPGCEEVNPDERLSCLEEQLQKHIRKHQRYPEAAIEMRQEGRVYVSFQIDQKGVVRDIQLRGPSKILENEAERIIAKLPQMIPGKMGATPVKVRYVIPIAFKLQH